MKKLLEAVQRAIEKLQAEGIEGWGLNNLYLDDQPFGELVQIGPTFGCASETCNHVSHDPAAPTYKWVPPTGWKLVHLGKDDEFDYYYITDGEEEEVIIKEDRRHYHDRLFWGNFEDVPEFLLARLQEVQEVEA